MARALSQAQIDAIAANGRELLRKQRAEAAPEVVNVANARALSSTRAPLVFRGRVYPMRPVPFEDGLTLLELAHRLEQLTKEPGPVALQSYRLVMREVADLCWRLLRPAGWRRLFWAVKPNPFRTASLEELRSTLGFFGRCQTISRN